MYDFSFSLERGKLHNKVTLILTNNDTNLSNIQNHKFWTPEKHWDLKAADKLNFKQWWWATLRTVETYQLFELWQTTEGGGSKS